jgi:hypothetical protein
MPQSDDEKRIRSGLKALTRVGKAAIKAAALIQRDLGVARPMTADGLLKSFSFEVAGKTFEGRMTQQQRDYLTGQTASFVKFADAIGKVIVNVNNKFLDSLRNLNKSLGAPRAARMSARALADDGTLPQLGTCYWDNAITQNVTQSYCIGVLAGIWQPNPFPGPPDV